jgi:hypothetical protein
MSKRTMKSTGNGGLDILVAAMLAILMGTAIVVQQF